VHAESATWEDTDWHEVVALYDLLVQLWPSPVVQLNRAVALGFANGPEAGLAAIDALANEPQLAGYHYLPAARVEHIRRNVPRNAKRGVSDFLPIQADLRHEARLRRNTVEGAALQAAIAWILQTPPGTRDVASAGATMRYAQPVHPGGTRLTQVRHYGPGTILEPTAGLEYKPGPMGAERNSQFLLVAQYVLRSIGLRWNMPEYLISGDASNANYASTLAAESPFVKAREADQQFYKRHFQSLCWKMLRLAWETGRFDRFAIPWERFVALLAVQIGTPAVASRDPLALAQTQALQMQAGILSRRTAAAQAGLDFDAEARHRHEEHETTATTRLSKADSQ
jgi:hypothetical protein